LLKNGHLNKENSMAKNYTERFLRDQTSFNESRLGIQFGRLCVKANLPPSMIANALGVSRQTVYNWFKGKAVRGKNIEKIEEYTCTIQEALEVYKTLPASNTLIAKQFITDNPLS